MKEIESLNDFQKIMEGDQPVLLDFYADWCGPCQTLLPIVEQLAVKHASDFVIAKVNVDKVPELSQKFNIRSIPSLFFIKNGEVKENILGLRTTQELDDKIHHYLAKTTL
jgi:thioredoxin